MSLRRYLARPASTLTPLVHPLSSYGGLRQRWQSTVYSAGDLRRSCQATSSSPAPLLVRAFLQVAVTQTLHSDKKSFASVAPEVAILAAVAAQVRADSMRITCHLLSYELFARQSCHCVSSTCRCHRFSCRSVHSALPSRPLRQDNGTRCHCVDMLHCDFTSLRYARITSLELWFVQGSLQESPRMHAHTDRKQ